MKKILVVGSWAKEQITVENIKKNSSYEVFSYLDTKNPALTSLVDGFCLGNLLDSKRVLSYAKEISPDLIIITTAGPLACGIVDFLETSGYRVFGPRQLSAQLEADKAFTRCLVQKYAPESLPEFKIFTNKKQAVKYASQKNFAIAVKPTGLTEGLGVKVFDGCSESSQLASEYISKILSGKGNKKVIVEEKLKGQEFTLQCFVCGKLIIPTLCVQDFKKLLAGDTGPNTASMGSYSAPGEILPFMKQADYDRALEIIEKTIFGFLKETGQSPRGILYGQFMITELGVKLIEYNFRPGDPEWLNTVFILEDNIFDIIELILSGNIKKLSFQKKATVCKYITPKEYPYQLNQSLEVELPLAKIKKEGVGVYYSCGLGMQGELRVGSERGIAFLAAAETIPAAANKVDAVISEIKGNFYYRKDIGTKKQIEQIVKDTIEVRQKICK